MRHPRSREPTPVLRRNATVVQKHHRVTGRHRTLHASVRQKQRYHVDPETYACGKLSRREDTSCHIASTGVPRPRTRVEHVYQIIEFQPNHCFRRFGESASTARREGDSDPNKTIIADTMKLIGNSGYGKTVTDVHRHRDVQYCTDVGASLLINNRRFHQLDSSSTMPTGSRWKRK